MKKNYFGLVATVIVATVSGCSSNQKMPIANVEAEIAPNRAVIELHRTHGYLGAVRGVDVYDNGKLVGEIANDSKLIWEREADTKMCLNREQSSPVDLLVNPLIIMLSDPNKPDCFKVDPGKVNKFKFDYMKGLFFTQQSWEQLMEKEMQDLREEATREKKSDVPF
jgi:hypothetical protein